jgi:hypothetical protein
LELVQGQAESGKLITRLLMYLAFPLRLGLPAVTTFLAFAIGLAVGAGSDAFETTFYEATAQIIPVLLLVLAVEARFFRIDLMPFKQVRASFEVELRRELGENPSPRAVVDAMQAVQSGRSFAYVQQRLLMVLALLTLVAGEVVSVLVLGRPEWESGGLQQGLVLGATFAGLGAVMVAALTGPMPIAESPPASAEGTDKGQE